MERHLEQSPLPPAGQAESTPPAAVPYFLVWLRWALLAGLGSGVLIPAGLFLLQTVSQAMASNQAAYMYIEWLAVLLLTGLISLLITLAVRGYVSNLKLWFLVTWIAWTLALEYTSTPVYFSYYGGTSASSFMNIYQQAASILSPIAKFLLIGFVQWLVLRIYFRRAWTWMLWHLGGMALSVGILLFLILVVKIDQKIPDQQTANIVNWIISGGTYMVAYIVTAFGLPLILRNVQTAAEQRSQPVSLKTFLPEWAAAILGYTILWYAVQSSGLLTLMVKPFQNTDWLARTSTYFWFGILAGLAQWLVLRKRLPNAWIWFLATFLGLLLGKLAAFGLGNSASSGGFLSGLAQQSYAISLVLTMVTWVIVAALQSLALWWNSSPRWGWWFLVQLVASLASFLGAFYVNQLFGLALGVVITGFALIDFFKRGLGETWIVSPVEPADGAVMETDGDIIAQRARQYFGPRAKVAMYSDGIEVVPGGFADRDLAQRTVTRRGLATVFGSALPPAENQPVPEQVVIVFDQDQVDSADVLEADEPEDVCLEIIPSAAGIQQIEAFKSRQPESKLYLAVDGRVVISQPFDVQEGDALELPGLLPEEASYLAALLNNEPLSIAYKVE